MVERWNIGFQKDTSHFNFIVNPAGGRTINSTLHYPRTHYSTIPLFHHSNYERSELTCILNSPYRIPKSDVARLYFFEPTVGMLRRTDSFPPCFVSAFFEVPAKNHGMQLHC